MYINPRGPFDTMLCCQVIVTFCDCAELPTVKVTLTGVLSTSVCLV